MMPKSVYRLSDDIMLYLFDLEADSDFRSSRAWNHPTLGCSAKWRLSVAAAGALCGSHPERRLSIGQRGGNPLWLDRL